jgi:hypothetical protein
MHVGWSAIFAAAAERERPTLALLRERVAARLDETRARGQLDQKQQSEPLLVSGREQPVLSRSAGCRM